MTFMYLMHDSMIEHSFKGDGWMRKFVLIFIFCQNTKEIGKRMKLANNYGDGFQ